MLNPKFPYTGNQIIISSGRVVAHAKDDAIFLFGKKGVGISTNATFNVDAIERVIINSNKIELGLRAETEGQPVLKGNSTLQQLNRLLDAVIELGDALQKIGVETLPSAAPLISVSGGNIRDVAKSVKSQLATNALSEVTYTK